MIDKCQCNVYPVAAEARSPGQSHVADVGRGRGGHWLIDHQGPVLEARPPGRLHLPELLQLLHNIHWGQKSWSSIIFLSQSALTSLPGLSVTHNLLVDVLGAPGPVGHQHDACCLDPLCVHLSPGDTNACVLGVWVNSLLSHCLHPLPSVCWAGMLRTGYTLGYLAFTCPLCTALPGCPIFMMRSVEWGWPINIIECGYSTNLTL